VVPSGRTTLRQTGRLGRLAENAVTAYCRDGSSVLPMRIPFPERITPWHAGCFAVILCTFEILQGTQPLFVGCVFTYIMLATAAFNLAGGLYRASGTYILANAILSLVLALCAKVVFGESADSNLRDPMTTILVYTAGMAGMLVAVAVSRKMIPKVALLERDDDPADYRQIGIGCLAFALAQPFLLAAMAGGEGTITSALGQFTQFLPLGLLLASYDEIRSSGGRRSMNVIFLLTSLWVIIAGGILATSKQALFTPLAIYAVVCGALRYKFRPTGVFAIAIVAFLLTYYLVPYSQVVRSYTRDISGFSDRVDAAVYWLSHFDEVRAEYDKTNDEFKLATGPHYYSEDRGFLERLSMVGVDDALINVADRGDKFGYQPMFFAVANVVPHFLWPGKPDTNYNNVYGHEIGVIPDDDYNTSISFGPAADAYNMGGWPAVLLLLPIVITVMFMMVDSVAGSIKKTPWGMVYTILFLHIGPEGSLGICIYVAFQTSVVLVVTVYAARYVLPIVGSVFFPERRKSMWMRKVREFPKTAVAPPPQAADGPV